MARTPSEPILGLCVLSTGLRVTVPQISANDAFCSLAP